MLLMINYLILEYSCFAMLCYFLLYNKVNRPHVCIYPLFLESPSHLIYHTILSRAARILQSAIIVVVFATKAFLILWKHMGGSLLGNSVYGISQVRILEWILISFSRVSSWPRDQTHISFHWRQILYKWAIREAPQFSLVIYFVLQQYMNHELPDVQAGFRKGRGTRD